MFVDWCLSDLIEDCFRDSDEDFRDIKKKSIRKQKADRKSLKSIPKEQIQAVIR